jgi:hypothetical protein
MSAPTEVGHLRGMGTNDRGRALLWEESGPDFTALATVKIMKIG